MAQQGEEAHGSETWTVDGSVMAERPARTTATMMPQPQSAAQLAAAVRGSPVAGTANISASDKTNAVCMNSPPLPPPPGPSQNISVAPCPATPASAQQSGRATGNSKTSPGKGGPVRKEKRAGLEFPVGRIHRKCKEGPGGAYCSAKRMGPEAAVYMTAVLEYLALEVLDLSGDVTKELKLKRIQPRHIQLAISGDEELSKLLRNVYVREGGVQPHIHPELLPPLHRQGRKTPRRNNGGDAVKGMQLQPSPDPGAHRADDSDTAHTPTTSTHETPSRVDWQATTEAALAAGARQVVRALNTATPTGQDALLM